MRTRKVLSIKLGKIGQRVVRILKKSIRILTHNHRNSGLGHYVKMMDLVKELCERGHIARLDFVKSG